MVFRTTTTLKKAQLHEPQLFRTTTEPNKPDFGYHEASIIVPRLKIFFRKKCSNLFSK